MKGLAVFVLFGIAICVIASPVDKYTTKYDNINLNEIISNKRLLKNYVNCLLDKGKCTPDGIELKKVLPDALKTDCAKCSAKQKEGANIILDHMVTKEPEWFEELEKKYDPERIYKKNFDKQLKEASKGSKESSEEKEA